MKSLTLRFVLVLAILMSSAIVATAEDSYTLDAFNERFNASTDDATTLAIYKDFIENGTDLDVIRQIQSRWSSSDPEAALAFAKELVDKNPKSNKFLYLYGRLVESDIEKVEIGRKVIALDPQWPYGYRLMMATYVSSLFAAEGPAEVRAKLEKMLAEDGPKFAKLAEIDADQAYAYEFLAKYQVYSKDAEAALATLDKAKALGQRWPSPIDYVNVKIGLGKFDEALADLQSEADRSIAEGSIPPDQRQEYIDYYYTSGLYAASAFDQVIKYKMSNEGWETDEGALYDIACAYARSGNDAATFEYLDKALTNGWERVEHISEDSDLERLHGDSRWATVIERTKANWEAGKPERKAETLGAKVLEPAPDWTLEDKDGNMVSLSSLRGSVLILDFWATWCGPCRMSMPVINEFVKSNGHEDVKIFSVNVWEQGKKHPKEFMQDQGYMMTLLYGNDDLVAQYQVQGIPYLCVIDKEGNIRFKETGYSEGLKEKLVWWTEDLL